MTSIVPEYGGKLRLPPVGFLLLSTIPWSFFLLLVKGMVDEFYFSLKG